MAKMDPKALFLPKASIACSNVPQTFSREMRGNAGQVLEEEARKAKEAAAIAAKEAAAAKASHGRSMGIESSKSLRASESLPVGSCASGLAPEPAGGAASCACDYRPSHFQLFPSDAVVSLLASLLHCPATCVPF